MNYDIFISDLRAGCVIEGECWRWINKRTGLPSKHTACGLYHPFKKTYQFAYQAIAAIKLGRDLIQWQEVAMHSCDNGWCNNPDHIKAGTYSDNTRDALKKGRLKSIWILPEPKWR